MTATKQAKRKTGKTKRGKVPKRDGRTASEARRRRAPRAATPVDPTVEARKLRATDPAHLADLMRAGRGTVADEPGTIYGIDKVEATGWVTYTAIDREGKPVGPRHTVTADRVEPVALTVPAGPVAAPGPAAATVPPSAARVAIHGRRKGRKWSGHLEPDGSVTVDGTSYPSPSAAGSKLTGAAVNGWTFWRLLDDAGNEVPLATLREGLGRRRPAGRPVDVPGLQAKRARIVARIAKLGAALGAIDKRLRGHETGIA